MRQQPLDVNPLYRTGSIRMARIFSNIISPPSLFAAAGFAIAWVETSSIEGLLQAALYGTLASLLPVLAVVYLYKTGRVSDLHMSDQSERHIPYLIGLTGALGAFLILRAWGGNSLLTNLILTHFVAMAILTVVNPFWLISAHVTSVTALLFFARYHFGTDTAMALLPLVGLTFYVRWFLKRHTMIELVSGLLAGWLAVSLLVQFGVFSS